MSPSIVLVLIVALAVLAFQIGKARSIAVAGGPRNTRSLHSLPGHYGLLTAFWCVLPALAVFGVWVVFQDSVLTRLVLSNMPAEQQALPADQLGLLLNDLRNVVAGNIPASMVSDPVRQAAGDFLRLQRVAHLSLAGVALGIGVLALLWARRRIRPELRARNEYERMVEWALFACSAVAVLTTLGIVLSIVFEAGRFFGTVPFTDFLFGTNWSPQTAIRADQVGSSGAFGAVPLFVGTLLISAVAMVVAVPLGLFSAIYLAEYASPRLRRIVKPLLEVLAGVPTVVYGFFAVTTVGPMLRTVGEALGLSVAGESALAAGLVMGIMIIPFVSSLADDMITAVPQSLRDGAYALGCDPVGDRASGGAARRVARDRRWGPARGVACHRRDHDRRDGRGARRQPHPQPARSGHHGHGPDRHAAGRRPGVRQPEDAGGVRAGIDAVPRHAAAQRHRPLCRHEVP